MKKDMKIRREVMSICKSIYKAKCNKKNQITTSRNVCLGTVLTLAGLGYIVNVNGENLEICW